MFSLGTPGMTNAKTLALLAAASMLWGNLAALAQGSVRRLLAYSAIAHSGYMLLAVMTRGSEGAASLLYYAFTYGLTAIGASVPSTPASSGRIRAISSMTRATATRGPAKAR